MTTLHAELCLQASSRATFARLARDWLTEGRPRLFPDLDRVLNTAGPSAAAPEECHERDGCEDAAHERSF